MFARNTAYRWLYFPYLPPSHVPGKKGAGRCRTYKHAPLSSSQMGVSSPTIFSKRWSDMHLCSNFPGPATATSYSFHISQERQLPVTGNVHVCVLVCPFYVRSEEWEIVDTGGMKETGPRLSVSSERPLGSQLLFCVLQTVHVWRH